MSWLENIRASREQWSAICPKAQILLIARRTMEAET
jgi:hypothetical protein